MSNRKGHSYRFTVVVTDDRFGSYREEETVLEGVDARLMVRNLTTEDEAIEALAQADAVLVNLFPFGKRVIDGLVRCKVISRYGVGCDNVDVHAATAKGIWVARVPDYSVEDVSDQALALLLGCARKLAYKDRKVREGKWNLQKDQPAYRVAGKTLGLVGYGLIARRLHRKVSGLGLSRVFVSDPYVDPSLIESAGGSATDLRTLLAQSDFVSVHVPLTDESRGMIGEEEIATMKRTAIFINTSRGPVVDEKALASALRRGALAGAGLDVFEKEPLPAGSPLKALDNVILSDHTGWYSEESVVELKTKAAQNVAAALGGGAPVYPVNHLAVG